MEEIATVSLAGSVGVSTLCFLVYWFWAHSTSYKRFLKRCIPSHIVEKYVAFFQKGLGVVLIGIIPGLVLLFFKPYFGGGYGLILENPLPTLWWIVCFGGPLFFVPYYSARKREMQAFYPQIRVRQWGLGLFWANILVWSIYLFSYEFLFRGFLLNSLLFSLDPVSAIVLTTAISVCTHMPKGAAETFGTIPFSIMLCLATVYTGSIWAAFIIHLVLALSNDFWALYFNPQMGVRKKGVTLSES